ncbi:tripartite motif-containing protein 59-like isoform X2 [Gigantopelta aegis]|uniref:tripartite motif-containing protein 59-like isoform X2 n=1 Tax=Gigantopelta aegis TaxID=1735272 RepID=UPI001B88E5A4|nr:tripartite motif-containing protein 59-like isoform X2 [Gigantopelta aegis]
MASRFADEEQTSMIGDDRISCPLCFEVYSDPRTLPCGHTYCLKCLQDHISASISRGYASKCPLCNGAILIPDQTQPESSWAAQFPRALALVDAIDQVKILKQRDAPSALKQPLKNALQLVCKTLRSFCGILDDNIKNEVDRLQSGLAVSAAEVSGEIDRRGAEIIQKLTETVHAEQNRLKKYLETSVLTTNNDIDTIFTKDKHLLQKGKENLKLGENLIKSGSDSEIKTNLSKLQKIASEISQTNPKTEIPELKITLTDSKKKNTETFSVDIGEILKPDIKSLTDKLTLTDTRTDRLTLTDTRTDRQTDRLTLTDTRTDRQTDRLTLTQTFHTKISSDKRDPCLYSIAVLGGERSKKIVVSDFNSCVKYFSVDNFKLIKYDLPSEPCGLARSRDQQVVVVLPGNVKYYIWIYKMTSA